TWLVGQIEEIPAHIKMAGNVAKISIQLLGALQIGFDFLELDAHEEAVDHRITMLGGAADGGSALEQKVTHCPNDAIGFGAGNGKDVFLAFVLIHARYQLLI